MTEKLVFSFWADRAKGAHYSLNDKASFLISGPTKASCGLQCCSFCLECIQLGVSNGQSVVCLCDIEALAGFAMSAVPLRVDYREKESLMNKSCMDEQHDCVDSFGFAGGGTGD